MRNPDRSACFSPVQNLDMMSFVWAGFQRTLTGFCLAILFLSLGSAGEGFSAEPPGSGDPLTQAQIENQKAQARYYSRQSDRRGFWRSLREFGWPVGVVAAGVAAIVAVGLN